MWNISGLKTDEEFARLGRAIQAALPLWATLTTEGYAQVPDLPEAEVFVIPPQVPGAFFTVVARSEVAKEYKVLQETDEAGFAGALQALREKVGYAFTDEQVEDALEDALDDLLGEQDGDRDLSAQKSETDEEPSDDASGSEESSEEVLWEAAELVLTEDDIAELALPPGGDVRPVWLKVRLIKPGWGNKRDNHYYSREVLKAGAKMFEGVPMYLTDHKASETNVRTLAGNVMTVDEFDKAGAPIGNCFIHQPAWAAQIRNMATEKGVLEKLPVSIRAKGMTTAYRDGERQGKAVAEFTAAHSVDFVTAAGAGGGVVSAMTEADAAESAHKAAHLSKEQVIAVLPADLPTPVRDRVLVGQYETEEAVKEAADRELHYVQDAVGALRPVGQEPHAKQKPKPENTEETRQARLEEAAKRKAAVLRDYGFGRVGGNHG